MKTPGMIRKIDAMGRIVIPKSMRSRLGIADGDLLELRQEEGRLVLQKFSCGCIFCGSGQNLIDFMDKPVCKDCIEKMKP